ncbi:hypothetical protein J6590_012228 [Homalodisca vitripennis]|nr:hypothetical protein J6590_012228 [Homalodisca vitripennis]
MEPGSENKYEAANNYDCAQTNIFLAVTQQGVIRDKPRARVEAGARTSVHLRVRLRARGSARGTSAGSRVPDSGDKMKKVAGYGNSHSGSRYGVDKRHKTGSSDSTPKLMSRRQ